MYLPLRGRDVVAQHFHNQHYVTSTKLVFWHRWRKMIAAIGAESVKNTANWRNFLTHFTLLQQILTIRSSANLQIMARKFCHLKISIYFIFIVNFAINIL